MKSRVQIVLFIDIGPFSYKYDDDKEYYCVRYV